MRVLLPVVLVLFGCSWPTTTERYGVPSDQPFQIVRTIPPMGASNVDASGPYALYFTDFPDPAYAVLGNLQLRSGLQGYDFSATVDLVDRAIVVRPLHALPPDTQVELVVTGNLSSLRGIAINSGADLVFTTAAVPGAGDGGTPPGGGSGDGGSTSGDAGAIQVDAGAADGGAVVADGGGGDQVHMPTRALHFAADVQPLFSDDTKSPGTCVVAGCHASVNSQAELSLTPTTSFDDLVGVAATERTPLLRVVAGDPTNSYLLRKLLGTPDIVGGQMPLNVNWDYAALRTLSDWIQTGALP